jgi:endonuclease-8
MPEGDTIFRAARTLNLALSGQPITAFESVFPYLSRVDFDTPIVGRTVQNVEARGKWMLMHFSGDIILLTHMLMSGTWHIYRPGEPWKRNRRDMRIVIATPKILAVAFKVPIAEFHTTGSLSRREGFIHLGPSVLDPQFNESEAVARLRTRPDLQVGVALLTQSLLSGIGNVFKSEICFSCGIHPFRPVSSLTESDLQRLVSQARKFMLANVAPTSGNGIVTYTGMRLPEARADDSASVWVYRRTGEPCRRCGTAIVSYKQGLDARTSFWCPQCQPLPAKQASAQGA